MKLGRILWKMQRYTALYFLVFIVYVEYLFFSNSLSYEFLINNLCFKFLTSLFIVLAIFHGFSGLWAVGTDYLTSRTLGFLSVSLAKKANLIRKAYEIFFLIVGALVSISYLTFIWL
jgi:succinate dehydrogenase hydrophobic anchor subunit